MRPKGDRCGKDRRAVRLMLDVHKNSVTACVRISETREALHQEILEFATTTRGLLLLRDWLASFGVRLVGMEARRQSGKSPPHKDEVSCTLCNADVCYGGMRLDGYSADAHSGAHCSYRRLCIATLGDRFRAWIANLLGHLVPKVDDLLGRLGRYLPGAYHLLDNQVVRPANPSMGSRPASSTPPAPFRTALGDSAGVAGAVLG
jgi:hypothetical protein